MSKASERERAWRSWLRRRAVDYQCENLFGRYLPGWVEDEPVLGARVASCLAVENHDGWSALDVRNADAPTGLFGIAPWIYEGYPRPFGEVLGSDSRRG